jgi:anti-sigma regulatory factor (Ser/Thr protein kinase)
VASDGLLSRLGGGIEVEGHRALRRWQAGSKRDEDLAGHLETTAPPIDDESALSVVWDGWDEEVELPPDDEEEVKRILRIVRARTRHVLGERGSEDLAQAVLEALDNAREWGQVRGRPELVWIGHRVDADSVTIEIRDRGPGIHRSDLGRRGGGLDVMRRLCDEVDVRRGESGGTIVTFVLRGGDDE